MSAEFIITIWRDNDATNIGTNDATNGATNSGANDLTINTNSTTNVGTNIGTDDSTNDIDNTLVDKPNDIANVATGTTNVATGNLNVATDHLEENKRIVDEIVKRKVHSKMSPVQIKECIIEACIVEHSIEELALLLNKTPAHLRNRFIPNLVADGILLPTKPRHTKGQTYMTNPKLGK